MWRDDTRLLDRLLAARKIRRFTEGVSKEEFLANEMLQHAIIQLEQNIGEAARQVSSEFQNAHPQIPWNRIIGMRHRLVHEYFSHHSGQRLECRT